MKNYALYSNSLYQRRRKLSNLPKKMVEMYLVCIETPLKGPIYTIVEHPDVNIENMDVSVTINMTYDQEDVPFSAEAILSSHFVINNVSNYYNMYPLIRQMFAFNIFSEMQAVSAGEALFISSIDIDYKNTKVHLDESTTDKKIAKTFDKISMLTDVSKILEWDQCIMIRPDDGWFIVNREELFEEDFKEVFIPISDTETLYKLTYDEFMLFCNIRYADVEISMYPKNDIDGSIEPIATTFLELIGTSNDEIDIRNVYDLLEGCLFIPQMILLMSNVWDQTFALEINCGVKGRDLSLRFQSNEIKEQSSVSFFELFKRLLDMEL